MRFRDVPVTDIDLQTRAAGRVLTQFSRSRVLLSVLWALVSEIQTLCNGILETMRARMPNAAVGENLNAIGRIVGQDRVLIDYSEIAWFTPDTANYLVDKTPVWVTGAPLYNVGSADDSLYRMLIQAKVSRNFSQFASIPEIQACTSEAFDAQVSMQHYNGLPFEAVLLIEHTAPLHVIGFLTDMSNDERADGVYLPPYPAQFRIRKNMLLYPETFGPDTESGAADVAIVTCGFQF